MTRIKKEKNFLQIAKAISERSTCLRMHVGAILLNENNHLISTGYNGAPVGLQHCDEIGVCIRQQYEVPPGNRYEFCHSCHSEQNVLIQAGKESYGGILFLISVDPKTGDVVENYPCFICSKLIINAKIRWIYIAINNDLDFVKITPIEAYNKSLQEIKKYGNISRQPGAETLL